MTLQEKAEFSLKAKESGDPRYLLLLMQLAARLGVSTDLIEQEIEKTARYAPN